MKFTEAAQHAKRMGQTFRAFTKLEEMCLTAARAEGACAELTLAREELADEVKVLTARAAKLRREKKEIKEASLVERTKASANLQEMLNAGETQLAEQRREALAMAREVAEDLESKRASLLGDLDGLKRAVGVEENALAVAKEAARVAREQIEGLN